MRLSDLWCTLRSQALQTTADEVSEWFSERRIQHDRRVVQAGRSGRNGTVDYQTQVEDRKSWVLLLTTGSRGAAHRLSEHVLAGCVDLSHLQRADSNLEFIPLFDDTANVWQKEDFQLVEEHSKIARWSCPDALELMLQAA